MRTLVGVLMVGMALVATTPAQSFPAVWGAGAPGTIPPVGTGGPCSNPNNVLTHTITAFNPGCVNVGPNATGTDNVTVTLNISHARGQDLRITLEHCGNSIDLAVPSASGTCQLSGQYVFADSAPTSFSAALVTCAGFLQPLQPGTYRPDTFPLAAFSGGAAGGPWNLTICDETPSNTGAATDAFITVWYNTVSSSAPGVPAAFGPGATSTISRTVNFPNNGAIGTVLVDLGIEHTWAWDVRMTLTHNNVTAVILPGNCGANAFPGIKLVTGGTYGVLDGPTNLCAALNALPVGGTLLHGNYSPQNSFQSAWANQDMQGDWILTITDLFPAADDGILHYFNVRVTTCAYDLTFIQLLPNNLLYVLNGFGYPGYQYINAVTFNAGAYPNGWFFGVDLTIPELFLLTNPLTPPPFRGVLDSCGRSAWPAPPPNGFPVAPGLTLYAVSLQVHPTTFEIVSITAPKTYTTN